MSDINPLCAGCKVVGDCYVDNAADKCPCRDCLIKSVCLELCEDAKKIHWAFLGSSISKNNARNFSKHYVAGTL